MPKWLADDVKFARKQRRALKKAYRGEKPQDDTLDALDRAHKHIDKIHELVQASYRCATRLCHGCKWTSTMTRRGCRLDAEIAKAMTDDVAP